MKSVKIELTESQREQVEPLLDALKEYQKSGKLGVSVGQLDGTYFEFTHAVFAVIDPVGAPKIHAAINGEVRRMKAEDPASIADAAKAAIEAEKDNFEVVSESGG